MAAESNPAIAPFKRPYAAAVEFGWMMAMAKKPLQAGAIGLVSACLSGGLRMDAERFLGLLAGSIWGWLATLRCFRDKWGPALPQTEDSHGASDII